MTLAGLFNGEDRQTQILLVSRIPRLIAIITAGMSMSVVGLIMQQLARNKFVTPSTAGTVEAASLGILVAILCFGSASMMQKMLVAFAFALAGTLIFMQILERIKFKDVIFVPLVGIMFGGVIGSVTTFFAYRYDLIQTLGAWTNGDFSGILRGRYELLYIAVPVTLLAYLFADRFTLAGMGEEFAVNLGLHYKQIVNTGLAIVALTTSVVVLTVGAIPFLGLIVPNVVTMIMGDNIKKSLPYTALLGALFVLACDIVGRTIRYPYEIPIGTIVGVLGSGMFLFLIMRRGAYAAG
ncbi:MAG: ABC transporter permease [Caldilineaceae bacterium]|nr:ABC transporter permease [Caldilineaceae bacterium]